MAQDILFKVFQGPEYLAQVVLESRILISGGFRAQRFSTQGDSGPQFQGRLYSL